jgi:hypothetical protein
MTVPLLTVVPTDFSTLDIAALRQLSPDLEAANENRPYIEGDHLHRGEFWVGPGLDERDPRYSDFLDKLERVFISKNVITEVVDRLVSAVFGREPGWAWVPRRILKPKEQKTDAEAAAIAELESSLTQWWDKREIHKLLKRLLFRMLWAEQCVARLYVPSGLTDAGGRLGVTTLDGALDKIFLDIPEPENGFVYEHPDTKQRLGVVFYLDADNKEACEVTYLKGANTVIQILPAASADVNKAENDFGGNLPIIQISVDRAMITEQVRSLQRSLNMTLTLLGKGMVDTHFVERMFFDTLPPGYEAPTQDSTGKVVSEGKPASPEGRTTGGRTDSYMQSTHYVDENDRTVLAKGNVTIRDPSDPGYTIKGSDYFYQCMLEEVRQDHILINQAATPSGKSREEARTDFASSGEDPQMQAELVGRSVLLTVVAMAEAFMGTPGKWTKTFKPVFKCNSRYGQLSPEERKQNIEEADQGFLSIQTAMSRNGVDDVDAEQSIIASQPTAALDLAQKRADVVNDWSVEFPREVALFMAGYTDTEITAIMKRVADSVSTDPTAPPVIPAPQGPKAPVAGAG